MSELPEDYDIAYMWLWQRKRYGIIPLKNLKTVCIPKFPRATTGYIISKKGAKKIISLIKPICDTIDDELNMLLTRNEIKSYASKENLIRPYDELESNICGSGIFKFID